MATETGELLYAAGSEATLNNTSSLTVTDGSFTAAAGTNVSSTNTEGRPEAEFVFTGTFSTAPSGAGNTMEIRYRYINIDGTNDEPAMDSEYKGHLAGHFRLDGGSGAATTQYHAADRVFLPRREVEVYLWNNSGQTMTAWKLTMTPKSYYSGA